MQTLKDLKKHFIDELVRQDLRRVFYILRQNVDNQSVKYDDLNLLHARYLTASHDQNIKGILPSEEARIIFNQIKATLLDFINDLTAKDLHLEPAAAATSIPAPVKDIAKKSTCNKGKILYKVPSVMELKKERKCIVRIAFDEKELEINDRQNVGSKVEPIRIAEVMEVIFIDQCTDKAFNIRTISSSEQLVDRGDFTEWIFYVEPLLEGVYELLLKVSVMEKRLGREIRKDIVMEKKIEVVANPIEVNDHLGYAQQEANMIAGGFMIPAGFEVLDQPIIWNQPMIPTLDPNVDLPVPAPATSTPPYIPVNEANSIGWLIFATAAVITLVAYFWEDPNHLKIDYRIGEELVLNISGHNPPFELLLAKGANEIDEEFSAITQKKSDSINYSFRRLGLTPNNKMEITASLIDKNKDQIDTTFTIEWNTPIINDLQIEAATSNQGNNLDMTISYGTFPFKITIIDHENKIEPWDFPLFHTREIPISLSSISFPKEGDFLVKVVDAENRMDSTNFSLVGPDYLMLKKSEIKKNKTLKIKLTGNRPPFKVFLDKNQITSVKNEGNHSLRFSENIIRGKRKVRVRIVDANGNSKTKQLKIPIGFTSIPKKDTKPTPFVMVGNDCINPENYKNQCAIIYIFNDTTPSNWKMNDQTFRNQKIKDRITEQKFIKFHFNLKHKKSDCNNTLFSNLENANTFVFQGNNKEPIAHRGFVESDKLLSSLVCLDNLPPPNPSVSVPPILTGKGDRQSLIIQLDTVTTYKYHTLKGEDISIEKQPVDKYRVQVISFKYESSFNRFITRIEDNDDIKEPLFIRFEDKLIKVYLGEFKDEDKAEKLLKYLRIYLKEKKIVTDDEYIKYMKVVIK